ncbi:uncharacterized protein BP01DRAFT_360891 [Aspergillus saccharolyticus JOP 1030-1]|uniref:Uncharacterized protein n=1 Tax=Aspergillus saccharolyticus JOP 1030-1 TaxID=1450539 RepID=A0A318ZZW8_9EURO|nr:hypothetical protein BP01DRAFT_360891 [Aspergillus saccharolyticus JOP 1030-1]PYH40912.1 hypothetical protein BP01DRAFT_360891 [Aspergillus saccharolyticus JOP 1030-1]
MSDRPSRPSSPYLEPPRKTVELEDPGAQDSAANSDDEPFTDANEGHQQPPSRPSSATGRTSPIPLTRVERVDENPAHGEVPGTSAYEIRTRDAVPDQVEVIPDGSRSRSTSTSRQQQRPMTPSSPIPRTVVEKVDLDQPSHGDVPGTPAYELRKADAVPDVVMKASDSDDAAPNPESVSIPTNTPVPETLLSRVNSPTNDEETLPQSSSDDNEESQPHAHRAKPSDPQPDQTETVTVAPPDSPASHRSHTRRKSSVTDDEFGDEETPGGGADDFDDFTEGQDDMGDFDDADFGDFDDGFQEPSATVPVDAVEVSQPPTPPSVPTLFDLTTIQTIPDLYAALDDPLDQLFPSTTSLPSSKLDPIPNATAIFSTERSLSLWSQLVAPPPLQPQNWVKSRIRRLFLVSLGVPVDLDEILPASKQKKLVLPSLTISSNTSTATPNTSSQNPGIATPTHATSHSRSQSLAANANRNSTQSTAGGTGSPGGTPRSTGARRRREASPPPELDLSAVRRLCATTDAALGGLTDGELKGHVQELEWVTLRASAVLEYWLKRLDGLVSEKEAFEGVIENLVNHARRVRK